MADEKDPFDRIRPTKRQRRALHSRAVGLALVLALFVVLIYLGTLAKLWG